MYAGFMALKETDFYTSSGNLHAYYSARKSRYTLIFLHGIGVSSRYMLPLADKLSRQYSVYALDLPGFGKSSKLKSEYSVKALAAVIVEFVTQNKIESPVLVGNSFGCQVALGVIKNNPKMIRAAVLTGPTTNIYERSHVMQILRWLQNLIYEPTRKMAWILMKDIWECGLLRVWRSLSIAIKDKPEENLDKVRIPILFLRGSLDPIAPRKWLKFLVGKNPLFEMAELPAAGHALNFNSPNSLASIIDNFIDRPLKNKVKKKRQ